MKTIDNMDRQYLDEYVELYRKVFSRAPWYDRESFQDLRDYFIKFFQMEGFLGYEYRLEGRLLGVSLGFVKPWIEGYEYYIDQFYLDSDHQRQGYGREFIDGIVARLDGEITSIMLTTEYRVPAFKFYIRNGFEPLEEQRVLVREIR